MDVKFAARDQLQLVFRTITKQSTSVNLLHLAVRLSVKKKQAKSQ